MSAASYKIGAIKKIEWDDPPYATSPLEDKRYFDCDTFKLSDSDIRFALRHAKPVSKRYFTEELISVGCRANMYVTFKNNDRLFIDIESTGRISARLENKAGVMRHFYYVCQPCEDNVLPWASLKPQGSKPTR